MQNRTPIPREERKLDLSFEPVPRRYRHDGWTPERQKAYIDALADTGCVSRAARMVNMSPESAYYLRRQPGAESFRRAWEAALDFGVQRLKDIAFERAIEGQLVPVFVAGKLMGFRRKKNDRLLMFCLRHYGNDNSGRRVTVNYFSSKATAGAAVSNSSPAFAGEGDQAELGGGATGALATAEASTTTIQTVTSSPGPSPTLARLEKDDQSAAILNSFEGVDLDPEAQADILRALESHAERRRALQPTYQQNADERFAVQAADPDCDFIRLGPDDIQYAGELESGADCEEFVPFVEGEQPWESIGEPVPEWFQQFVRDQQAKREAIGEQDEENEFTLSHVEGPGQPAPEPIEGDRNDDRSGEAMPRIASDHAGGMIGLVDGFTPATPPFPAPPELDPNDPRLDWRNWEGGEYVSPPAEPSPATDAEEPFEAPAHSERVEGPISPRTGRPLRPYKKRSPKPPFNP